jgi:DNA-binding PadR family transcriptional regulator
MKPNWFYILLSLSAGARYGTAIQDDVRVLSDGAVRLWPATLYGSLEELLGKGWLEEVSDEERPANISGRERYYRITPPGRAVLEAEISRLEQIARLARQRLALRTVLA